MSGYGNGYAAIVDWGAGMKVRPATVAVFVAIVAIGFAVGAWLAGVTRSAGERTTTATAVAVRTAAAQPARPAERAAPRPTERPTDRPTTPPAATTAPAAVPAATPTATPTATPLAVETTATASLGGPVQGTWDVEEATAQVGTIVWHGDVVARGGTMVFDGHKQSVGGRSAVPCERRTTLHAELAAGVSNQTVPYREVNCEGGASSGEMRVTGFAADNRSFSGSFWLGGTKLGEFTAQKR